jgi:hypothetical protein
VVVRVAVRKALRQVLVVAVEAEAGIVLNTLL